MVKTLCFCHDRSIDLSIYLYIFIYTYQSHTVSFSEDRVPPMPMDSHHFSPLKWPFGVMGHLHKHQPSQMTPMTCWFCLKAGYLIPSNVFSACSYQKGYLFDGYHPTVEFLMNHQLPTQIAMFRRQIHPFQSHCPAKLILPAPSSATPAPFGLRTLRKDPYQHLTSKVDWQPGRSATSFQDSSTVKPITNFEKPSLISPFFWGGVVTIIPKW